MDDVFENWGRPYKSWLARAIEMKKRNPGQPSMVGVLYLEGDDPPPIMCPRCWYTRDNQNPMTPLSGDKFVCAACDHREPF